MNNVQDTNDTAFKASFSSEPVPEPLTILGTMAAGSIGVALRRKAKKQEKNAVKV